MKIPFTDGTHKVPFSSHYAKDHNLAFNLNNVTSGTLSVRARKPGSSFFETIPNGVINLSNPSSISFTGAVQEYEFTLDSSVGTATYIVITDTATGGK